MSDTTAKTVLETIRSDRESGAELSPPTRALEAAAEAVVSAHWFCSQVSASMLAEADEHSDGGTSLTTLTEWDLSVETLAGEVGRSIRKLRTRLREAIRTRTKDIRSIAATTDED